MMILDSGLLFGPPYRAGLKFSGFAGL